jgi:hypothetical protein
MTYTKQTWSDNNPAFPASAARFDHLEQGVYDAGTTLAVAADQTADYTLVAADVGLVRPINASTVKKVAVPTDSQASLPINSVLYVASRGSADPYIAPALENLEQDPSHEIGLGYSNRGTGTVTRVQNPSSAVQFGSWCGQVALTTGTGGFFKTMPAQLVTPANPTGKLKAGDKVAWTLRIDNTIAATGLTGSIRWNNGGTQIQEDFASFAADAQTGKTLMTVLATVPTGADAWTGTLNATVAGAGNLYFDGSFVSKSATAQITYTDPSIGGSDMQWLGTSHASVSQGPIVRGSLLTVPQYGVRRLLKIAANEWWVTDQAPADISRVTDTPIVSASQGQTGFVVPFPATTTGVLATSGTAQFVRIYADHDINISKADFRVTNAAGANDNVEVAIWNSDLTVKHVTTGATSATINATGDKELSFTSSFTMLKGTVYYVMIASVFSSTAASFDGIGNFGQARAFGSNAPQATYLTKTGVALPVAAPITSPSAALTATSFVLRT